MENLDRWIAENIMKFAVISENTPLRNALPSGGYIIKETGICFIFTGVGYGSRPFHPRTNIAQAMRVVGKMKTIGHGWWLDLRSPFLETESDWFAGFTPLGTSGWNGRPDHVAANDNPATAICEAAKKTLEE